MPRHVPDPALAAALAAIPSIRHLEVDGVRVLHAPAPGPTTVSLSFRVGEADEPLEARGITHLLEHLVMSEVSAPRDGANAQTSAYRLAFFRHGTPEACGEFLRAVCAHVSRVPVARLAREVTVLRTEAAQRRPTILARHAIHRYGFRGLGRVALEQHGLRLVTAEALQAWADRHLVAGNAVAWIAGDLPPELSLALPPGPRVPPPPTDLLPGVALPAQAADAPSVVSLSFEADRSMAMTTAMAAFDDRANRALRRDDGLAYDVAGERLLLAAERQLVTYWASCLPETAARVSGTLLDALDDVMRSGMAQADLAARALAFARQWTEPGAELSSLDATAEDVLMGAEPRTIRSFAEEQASLTPGDVAAALAAVRDSLLLLAPAGGRADGRGLADYPGPTQASFGRSRTFHGLGGRRGRGRGVRPAHPRLVVGRGGISVDGPDGRLVAVPWDACLGVVRGAHSREVLGTDGTTIVVQDFVWQQGEAAIAAIDRAASGCPVIPPPPWPDPDA